MKYKKDWILKENMKVLKDTKVRNILHNSLDVVMSNMVIVDKTIKEIWDALDEVYGRLKTCYLELELRKNMKSNKAKSVSLNTEHMPTRVKQRILDYFNIKEKIKYKKLRKQNNSSRKSSNSYSNDMYKKRYDKQSKSENLDKSKEKCYSCDEISHFATEC